eukprot:CAMPEP_0115375690 /NCGR_PEP_ID=MMETSP0271-20121206/2591_1 /TAXON_ID=71861 /ORGANISM="Scrippsiella trochoidea, Strain CCMP3099" /LENGTH=146 /DNA_ID=CAMNT_0002798759 /DNA_START=305 /DNA_END=745 /DNA_ORIENTATION=+
MRHVVTSGWHWRLTLLLGKRPCHRDYGLDSSGSGNLPTARWTQSPHQRATRGNTAPILRRAYMQAASPSIVSDNRRDVRQPLCNGIRDLLNIWQLNMHGLPDPRPHIATLSAGRTGAITGDVACDVCGSLSKMEANLRMATPHIAL